MLSLQDINYTNENLLQNGKSRSVKDFLSRNSIFVALLFACFFFAFAFDATIVTNTSGATVLALAVVFGYGCYLYAHDQLTTERLIALIFIAGFILRLQYVLSTSITTRQHDVGEFSTGEIWGGRKGHAGYIEWFFFNKFSLINKNPKRMGQFYHPPFHYIIAALWMHLFTDFGAPFGMTYARAAASVQYLTLFYSSSCMLIAERIFRKLGLKKNGLVLACALIALHPTFILLSASINNDILSILLIFLAIYCTICWYQHPTYLNIIGIALSVGFGMMTKLSAALIAPPIALVFLVKLITDRRRHWKPFRQFSLFGVICVPLGLGYGIRNLIKFFMPIFYVSRLNPRDLQFIGRYSAFERLFDFSKRPFSNVFENWIVEGKGFCEYNPFVAILKTSCFGEYDFSEVNSAIVPYCRILLILNAAMILIAVCATLYYLCRKNSYLTKTLKVFIGGYYFLMIRYYLDFCFKYPHTCSMDFRYIVPTVLVGAIFLGIMTESIQEDNARSISGTMIYYTTNLLTIFFVTFSAVVYLMLGM